MDEHSSIIVDQGDRAMTYSPRTKDFELAAATPEPRRGLLRRAFEAVFESRRRSAERDIARLVARCGGRLTDDIERRITERLINSDWNFRR
jgi:hypothetical protein